MADVYNELTRSLFTTKMVVLWQTSEDVYNELTRSSFTIKMVVLWRTSVVALNTCFEHVVEIETRCKIPIWQTFGRITWHVIPEPPATLQGAATWRIQCHDSGATCHIAVQLL